jgi:hypothetical protein
MSSSKQHSIYKIMEKIMSEEFEVENIPAEPETTEKAQTQNSLEGMRTELIELVTQAKAGGVNFQEVPALFKWTYPEHPDVLFQMLIKGIPQEKEEEKSLIILNS